MSKSSLNEKHWVVKKNELNDFNPLDLRLQELRFFSIYLSKINPDDLKTRVVRFSIADFQAIMEFGRIDIKKLKVVADGLLTKVMGVSTETGGFIRFQVFKECRIDKDKNNQWYVEIDAHDRALPLMFDFKTHYFKYELWNALRLKSRNQLRMYEVLKQYEKAGNRIIALTDLRDMLGIEKDEYTRFNAFKQKVLDTCKAALSKHTDILFTYEPYGKKGRGGKILELKFTITKNKDFVDPLSLDRFINIKAQTEIENDNAIVELLLPDKNRLERMAAACGNSFSDQEMEQLDAAIKTYCPEIYDDIDKVSDRLSLFYKQAKAAYDRGIVSGGKHGYLLGIIKNSAKESAKGEEMGGPNGIDAKKGKRRTKFQNYEGREWDYDKMAKMEAEHLNKRLAK